MRFPARLAMLTIAIAGIAAPSAHASSIFNMTAFYDAQSVASPALDIWVDVIDQGSSVDFEFHNNSSVSSSVTHLYFENFANFLSGGAILGQSGTDMRGSTRGTPHSGIGDWDGTKFRAKARHGYQSNGIQQGEQLTVRFQYADSNYQSLLSAISDGRLDLAQKVGGVSGSTVWMSQRTSSQEPVPLPASIWLLGSGLVSWVGGGAARKKLKRA